MELQSRPPTHLTRMGNCFFAVPNLTSTVTVPDTGINGIEFDTLGGNDSVTVNSVQPSLSGNFTITGGTGSDSASVSDAITTTGTGAVDITVSRNIVLNAGSSITTVDGGITLSANATGTTAGNSIGLDADSATIQTTGAGNISLTAQGGDDAGTNNHNGIFLHNGATISSTGLGASAGTITLNGTGGAGTALNMGVRIDGSGTAISSVDGNVQITGTGGSGSTFLNMGAAVIFGATVSSAGTGANAATITIMGTGGTGTNDNVGVDVELGGASVTSAEGDIEITGIGGAGTAEDNFGVIVDDSGVVESTGTGASAANITITGTGGSGTINNDGVTLENQTGLGTTQVRTIDGDIQLNGTGGASGDGVQVRATATLPLKATGDGNIQINGDGTGGQAAVQIDSEVNSSTGDVTITSTDAADSVTVGATRLIDSNNGDVTVTAGDFEFGGLITSSGALTLQPADSGSSVGIGGGTGDFNLDDAELALRALAQWHQARRTGRVLRRGADLHPRQ
jgi:hypothetical protein